MGMILMKASTRAYGRLNITLPRATVELLDRVTKRGNRSRFHRPGDSRARPRPDADPAAEAPGSQARLVRRLGKLRPLTAGGGRPGIAHHTRSHRPLKGSQTSGSAGRGSAWLCVDTPGRKLRANRRRFVTAAVRRETAPRGEVEPSSPTRSRALDMAYGYSVQ